MTPGLPMSLDPGLTAAGFGTVVLTRHYAADGWTVEHVTVDHADPEIVITDDLITEIAVNLPDDDQLPGRPFYAENFRFGLRMEPSPVRRLCPNSCTYPSHPFCWTSWLFHVDAKDRHLVYRLNTYDLELHAWHAAWPD